MLFAFILLRVGPLLIVVACLYSSWPSLSTTGNPITCDGFIGSGPKPPFEWCSAIFEFENELGATSSDKYFQGQAYYAYICQGSYRKSAMSRTCFPCLLLEIQGPHLR